VRIVHTSDWHAGRVWKGVDRLPELAAVLDDLGDAIERDRIDLLLVSGDVFDSGAPAAEAERLVFRFLRRVARAGVRTVVVAGNHDHPARLDAWGTLAELAGVHVVGVPRRADAGGVVEIETTGGECAVVACVPFAPPRGFVSALELAHGDTEARQRYADSLKAVVDHLCASFRPDAVNLLVAHTHVEGAALSGSERQIHVGDQWAATAQALPARAHYVALGHIHKPQRIATAGAPAYYAGSPLQLDFGEAGEEKSYVVVDARPRQPARVERVPYRGGTPLAVVRATLAELARDAERLHASGWLRVTVPLDARDPDVNGKVRRLLPNAVSVDVELPEVEEPLDVGSRRGLRPAELYRAYHLAQHGVHPEPAVADAFARLWAEAEGA
jgi:exonuclease SbcD